MNRQADEKFDEKWLPSKRTGCWVWIGARNPLYGDFRVMGELHKTHRYAWERWRSRIPEGMQVCHRCDNPPCVNPEHLFLGTSRDNAADCINKGRKARGTEAGGAKLTEEVVCAIRQAHSSGGSVSSIARAHGISRTTVCVVVHRRTWRHV